MNLNYQKKSLSRSSKNIKKISLSDSKIPCKKGGCEESAISLSDYCWTHTENKKEEYRKKIQNWASKGKSMKKFFLKGADLSGLDFRDVNLSEPILWRCNLSGALLRKANLSGAILWLANLTKADIREVNLSRAQIRGADLSYTSLWGINLKEALLNWTNLTGAKNLTRKNFSTKLTRREKKDAINYRESYLFIKNFFIQNALHEDASWAAFREKTLERLELYEKSKIVSVRDLLSLEKWRNNFGWLGSKIFSLICGYGEKALRVIFSSLIIIFFFSVVYYSFSLVDNVLTSLDYLYFSIMTFTTLGYGDLRPINNSAARMVASFESFIGVFMMGVFVWTLARKFVAR